MNRRFRVVCICYDRCEHLPSCGYLEKPMHSTRAAAVNYAEYAAVEDIFAAVNYVREYPKYSLRMDVQRNSDTEVIKVYYTDDTGNEYLDCEYLICEVIERDDTHTNFLYRGFRIELNIADKQYRIYDDTGLINQAMNMRACCDIVDTICAEMLRIAT